MAKICKICGKPKIYDRPGAIDSMEVVGDRCKCQGETAGAQSLRR